MNRISNGPTSADRQGAIMKDDRPNILLIMADQMRGDCLGVEGHPVLQTPQLDALAETGVRFHRAYSACPVCVPARRTLMTGTRPCTHGVVMNHSKLLNGPTLPGELSRAGYQTHLVGKLHLWPKRKLYGFHSADWSDTVAAPYGTDNDYVRFLRREGLTSPNPAMANGVGTCSWMTRPWHLEERLHFSNWCADRAIEFLERRDPTVPFFLKVSFYHPHQPCTPPPVFYERYMNRDLPEPYVGEWARIYEGPRRGLPVENQWRVFLDPAVMKQYRAGYYGSISHIDEQIGRILWAVSLKEIEERKNTIVVFTSDHGEMLGDHQWLRKRSAYEPSARIPFLFNFPASMGIDQEKTLSEPVELMDVMPTLLDAAGLAIPGTVEGRSLLPLLMGKNDGWREYLHGECSDVPSSGSGMQYLTDRRRKYIWLPGQGREQYFDLENDPREMVDLIGKPERGEEIALWRERLIRELTGRPEGFTDGKILKKLNGPTPKFLPEGR